jgi:hypothetical protein
MAVDLQHVPAEGAPLLGQRLDRGDPADCAVHLGIVRIDQDDQIGDGARQIPRIPQDDCGNEQVEAGSKVLLVLIGAVADLAEPMDEDRARQAVAGFALVQLLPGLAAPRR